MASSSPRTCRQCGDPIDHLDTRARYCVGSCKSKHNFKPLTPKQRSRLSETQAIWTRKWKAEAMAVLGNECAHCGFSDPRALQFDHVNGDGAVDLIFSDAAGRRQRKGRALGTYYKRIAEQAEPGRHQLLCANCNWIKRVENQEYTSHIRKVV